MKTKNIITSAIWLAIVIASRFIKINMLIGSSRLILSGIIVTLPVIGSLFPATHALIALTALAGSKGLCGILPLTLWAPSLCAALSWSISDKNNTLDALINFVLPFTCIVAFVMHVTDSNAAWYSLYWIIPPAIYAFRHIKKSSNLFLVSLQSTFVAHAVGSIIWLFMIPMTATQWVQLMPLVAVERLTIASASVLMVIAIRWIVEKFVYSWHAGVTRAQLAHRQHPLSD